VIDEVLDSADANTLALIQDVLAKDLKHSAVIHIGRENANDRTFERVLHLIKDPTVRRLPRKGHTGAQQQGYGRRARA
jgi:vitamin B12/bleomycin/antimicrobial peptide transport system ATP-binding/permease protein